MKNWAWAPGESREADHYTVLYRDVESTAAAAEEGSNERANAFVSGLDGLFGDPIYIDPDETAWLLSLGPYTRVAKIDHDVDDVTGRIEASDTYEIAAETDGFSVAEEPEGRRGLAFDGSYTAAVTHVPDVRYADSTEMIEDSVIATQSGDVDMYVDEVDQFSTCLGEVSGADRSLVHTKDKYDRTLFDDVVGFVEERTHDPDVTQTTVSVVCEAADDFDEDDLQIWAESISFDVTSWSKNGRVGVLEGTL
jgi:hypothetical protein